MKKFAHSSLASQPNASLRDFSIGIDSAVVDSSASGLFIWMQKYMAEQYIA